MLPPNTCMHGWWNDVNFALNQSLWFRVRSASMKWTFTTEMLVIMWPRPQYVDKALYSHTTPHHLGPTWSWTTRTSRPKFVRQPTMTRGGHTGPSWGNWPSTHSLTSTTLRWWPWHGRECLRQRRTGEGHTRWLQWWTCFWHIRDGGFYVSFPMLLVPIN